MSDPNQGSPAPQAGQGSPAPQAGTQGQPAPQAGPGGGPDARGEQAPATPASPPQDLTEQLDGAHRAGYAKAREQLFRDIGLDFDPKGGRKAYLDAVHRLTSALERGGDEDGDDGAGGTPGPAGDGGADGSGNGAGAGGKEVQALIKDLQRENAKLRRQADSAAEESKLHAARDLAALRTEVRGMLRDHSFVAEALDDVVDLFVPDPHKPRQFIGRGPDGVTPTLLELQADGEVRTARMGLEEWLQEQTKSRPWFVAGKVAPGTGSRAPEGSEAAPADPWNPTGYSYEERRREIRERERGRR